MRDAAALRKWSQLLENESARAAVPPKRRVGVYPLAQPVDESNGVIANAKPKGFCEHGEPAGLCKKCV